MVKTLFLALVALPVLASSQPLDLPYIHLITPELAGGAPTGRWIPETFQTRSDAQAHLDLLTEEAKAGARVFEISSGPVVELVIQNECRSVITEVLSGPVALLSDCDATCFTAFEAAGILEPLKAITWNKVRRRWESSLGAGPYCHGSGCFCYQYNGEPVREDGGDLKAWSCAMPGRFERMGGIEKFPGGYRLTAEIAPGSEAERYWMQNRVSAMRAKDRPGE